MSGLRADVVVEREGLTVVADLDVADDEVVALVGPNGAGKSTVVAALCGLVPVTAGRVDVGGRTLVDTVAGVDVPTHGRRLGVVFQDVRLLDHLSVLDDVAYGPRSRGVGRAAAHRIAHDWLARCGADHLADRQGATLSGGEGARVALARALATEPVALLLDEPTAAVDVDGRAALRGLLADVLAELRVPTLLVTHDAAEVAVLADRVAVLDRGSIVGVATPQDVRRRPPTPWAARFVGTNLLPGTAHRDGVEVDGRRLPVASSTAGPVLLAVRPTAVALHRVAPTGSPRLSWATRVVAVEHGGDGVRVETAAPVSLVAAVTPAAAADLELEVGTEVWVAVKATDVEVLPA